MTESSKDTARCAFFPFHFNFLNQQESAIHKQEDVQSLFALSHCNMSFRYILSLLTELCSETCTLYTT